MKLQVAIIFLAILLFSSCETPGAPENYTDSQDLWVQIIDEARWAQNAHNIQSWKLTEISNRKIIGSLDENRLLPETDPFNRQLVISLGAFSESARISAFHKGWHLQINWIADNEWDSRSDIGQDLFEWILAPLEDEDRSSILPPIDTLSGATVKYALVEGKIESDNQVKLTRSYSDQTTIFSFHNNEEIVHPVIKIAKEAFKIEMEYEPTLMESYNNTRYGRKQREETPYGISLLGNFPKSKIGFIEFLSLLFPYSPEKYGQTGIDMFNGALTDTTQILVMKTKGNTPQIQFEAGMLLQGIWMEAIADGFNLLPLSQPLQEYEAVQKQYEEIHELLAEENETLQMILAVNKPESDIFLRSPRLAPDKILVSMERIHE